MKRIIAALAIVLALSAPALAQPPPHFTATYSLAANADPSGICTNEVRFWINNVTNDMFSCYGGTWYPVGGAGAPVMSFPITATSGATTVTLTGDAVAATGSYLLSNATQGGGWNTALGGALGFSDFAFNSIFTATNSATLNDSNAIQDVSLTNDDFLARLRVLINGESQDHPHVVLTTEGADSTTANLEVQSPTTGSTIGFNVSDGGNQTVTWLAEVNPAAQQTFAALDGTLASYILLGPTGPADSNVGTKPTCDSTTRKRRWFTEGGAGVADTYEVCMKSAADTYAWVVIAVNP
jgi:hypothetical protein